MKNYFFLLAAALLFGISSCSENIKESGVPDFEWMKDVGARELPDVSAPTLFVNEFGAKGDAVVMNTEFIQAAIDSAYTSGGGKVSFDPGIYLTGAIFVKSGVTLEIPKGTQIIASQDLADYPIIDTRVAGIEMKWPSAILNIIDQNKVAIIGDGVVHGRGKPFWDKYWEMRREYQSKGLRWIVDYDSKRVRGILVQNSQDVSLKDFVLYQAGFWSLHILYSNHVTVDGMIISNNIEGRGPSTDGVDIDSSTKVLVQNCIVNCNDDNFCLKAGRDADGLRVNRPCEYIVIRDCVAGHGDGLFTCGSETSGGIRNVVAYNLKGVGTKNGIRFKSAYNRGGVVENIYIYNIEMVNVDIPFIVQMNWNPSYSYSKLPEGYNIDEVPDYWKKMLTHVNPEVAMPKFKNIHFNNVTATNARVGMKVDAPENGTVDGFHLTNVSISANTAGKVKNAKDWVVSNSSVKGEDGVEINFSEFSLVN